MPTYSYKCENSHTKDIFHGMDEAPRMYCHCGKTLKRIMSAPANISFKGQGFYSTDKNK